MNQGEDMQTIARQVAGQFSGRGYFTLPEIHQEALVGVWLARHLYDPKRGRFAPFAQAYARGFVIDRMRSPYSLTYLDVAERCSWKRQNWWMHSELKDVATVALRSQALSQFADREEICYAMSFLGKKSFEYVYDYFFRGLNQQAIADKNGISDVAVSSRIKKSLAKMKAIICKARAA